MTGDNKVLRAQRVRRQMMELTIVTMMTTILATIMMTIWTIMMVTPMMMTMTMTIMMMRTMIMTGDNKVLRARRVRRQMMELTTVIH